MSDATSQDAAKRERIEALYARSRRHFSEVPELTAEALLDLRQSEEVVLVDVRKPEEQQVSMIPGALTSAEYEARAAELDGKKVIAYCTLGHRSGLYARELAAEGRHAYNLKGAILSWTHAGGELVDAAGPTRRVHVGGPTWNLAADGYEPVW